MEQMTIKKSEGGSTFLLYQKKLLSRVAFMSHLWITYKRFGPFGIREVHPDESVNNKPISS